MREILKQGSIFMAFGIPFVGLIGLIAAARGANAGWGNAADWVQAIGAIGALGVAIFISSKQRQEQIEDVHRRERVVTAAILELAKQAENKMTHLHSVCSRRRPVIALEPHRLNDEKDVALKEVDQVLAMLSGIDLMILPSEQMIPLLVGLKDSLSKGIESARATSPPSFPSVVVFPDKEQARLLAITIDARFYVERLRVVAGVK